MVGIGQAGQAEKPHPWAVDHEPMGPGAMGPVGGRGAERVGCVGGQEQGAHDKHGRRGRVPTVPWPPLEGVGGTGGSH